MLLRIAPVQATIGMFVCGFEGSWFKHPFWRARFIIEDDDTLERIQSSTIDALIIDTAKGVPLLAQAASADEMQARIETKRAERESARQAVDPEIERARHILEHGKAMVTRLFEDARLGKLAVTQDVHDLVDQIALSVERNQATLINMARLKNKDEYTYLHSVAVCALMINFARQLNKPETEVQQLGVAGLLHDVGKMAIPPDILNKAGRLTDEEFAAVKAHPRHGHELLKMSGNVPDVALDVALHHHEKVDGSGYPFGLRSAELSVAARMGAICDIYDALTSHRCYKPAWTPSEAITRMSNWKGHLDPALLFAFKQSIGIFPPGLLVRLRSNRLAVILPNGRRGSRPMARTFFDARARLFLPAHDVQLKEGTDGDQVVSREEPSHWPFPDWIRLKTGLMEGRYQPPCPGESHAA